MASIHFYRSIRAKTALLFFLVFVIIVLPVNYLIYSRVSKTLIDSDGRELRNEAEKLLEQTRLDPPTIPLPLAGYKVKIQFNSDLLFQDVFTSPGFPETDAANYLLSEYQVDTLRVVNVGRTEDYAQGQLLLSLARSNNGLMDQLSALQSWLFIANAAALFIAGVLVFVVTGITLRPIQKIISVAQRINASNSIERVPVAAAKDETRVLAETINAMLSRIESSIKDQTNFFASAAHELRTPLAIMQTELSLALQQATDTETQKILNNSLTEVQRLESVIHDFLLISQLKTDTLTLRRKTVSADEIIYAALKKTKYLSLERNISVRVNIEEPATDVMVDVDFDKMETVLINLIENAIRYTTDHVVAVTLSRTEEKILIGIINAMGDIVVRTETLKQEFNKSSQYSTGLGMGLWISDRIISMHGGEFLLKQDGGMFQAVVALQKTIPQKDPKLL